MDSNSGRRVKQSKVETAIEPEDVARFLEQHPDFFRDREQLLTSLVVPHQEGSTISLVEKQIALLRTANDELQERLGTILHTARQNEERFERIRKLVLELIEADTAEQLFNRLHEHLVSQLHCVDSTLILFSDPIEQAGSRVRFETRADAEQHIGGVVSSTRPVLGRMRDHEVEWLFEVEPSRVGSCALLSVGDRGLLACASELGDGFDSSMGTLFLELVADVVERLLVRLQLTG